MTWYEMTWYEMTWYEMTWCEMTWCEMTWCEMTWCEIFISLTTHSFVHSCIWPFTFQSICFFSSILISFPVLSNNLAINTAMLIKTFFVMTKQETSQYYSHYHIPDFTRFFSTSIFVFRWWRVSYGIVLYCGVVWCGVMWCGVVWYAGRICS